MFTSNAVLVVTLWFVYCRHFIAVAQQQQSPPTSLLKNSINDNTQCQTDIEWMTHPILCHVLQRLVVHSESPPPLPVLTPPPFQQQQQQQHSITATSSLLPSVITSNDLYQFSAALGWIVDIRSSSSISNTNEKLLNMKYTDDRIVTTTTSTTESSRRMLHRKRDTATTTTTTTKATGKIPVVIVHGMGDSCYNDGMIHITKFVSSLLQNVYAVCIPIGTSQSEDTNNGYFMNMNDSIDYFAQQVKEDIQLMTAQTFYAIGLSQGNNIIRGYIAKYNSVLPSVHTFISINGVNAGIGAVPHCIPEQILQKNQEQVSSVATTTPTTAGTVSSSSSLLLSSEMAFTLCDLLMEQASAAAYTTFAQKHSFQANYWRDPRPSEYDTYRTYSQLAKLNNEVLDPIQFNETLKVSWSYTSKFVWIMAQDDRTVWPPLGEQWGTPDPYDPYRHILSMNETQWYQKDYFGLRTAQEQNKNYFESFPGDHLQFTKDDLQRWVETYLS